MDPNLSSYLASVFPRTHTVLGETLKPLALGHIKALAWTRNAFLLGGPSASISDLAAAVWICSHTGSLAVARLHAQTNDAWAQSIGEREKDCDLKKEAQALAQYMDDTANHTPPIIPNDADGRALGAPYLAGVELCLLGQCAVNHYDLDNFSWLRALWLYAASMEIHGFSRIKGQTEIQHMEAVKEMEAALIKEANGD